MCLKIPEYKHYSLKAYNSLHPNVFFITLIWYFIPSRKPHSQTLFWFPRFSQGSFWLIQDLFASFSCRLLVPWWIHQAETKRAQFVCTSRKDKTHQKGNNSCCTVRTTMDGHRRKEWLLSLSLAEHVCRKSVALNCYLYCISIFFYIFFIQKKNLEKLMTFLYICVE